MSDAQDAETFPPLTSLSKPQRRALGTMIEKGITVPESYPLTLKALTVGCNQKSGRDPITNYSEDDLLDTLDQLRELGLAAVVHTESGRTERYRHYLRRRMPDLTEPQVAILGELLLRGQQSVGDLRARASRMAPSGALDSLDQLRSELAGLLEKELIQCDGSLDRRGVEVDHNLYEPHEGRKLALRPEDEGPPEIPRAATSTGAPVSAAAVTIPRAVVASGTGSADLAGRVSQLEATCAALLASNQETKAELAACRSELDRVGSELRQLRDALGA